MSTEVEVEKSQGQTAEQTAEQIAANVAIKCAEISKVFKDFWFRSRVKAVDKLSFEVYKGEIFGLLGPNGSGKSTTIKMMLGLLNPSGGRISILGKRPKDVRIKKEIGYLPEESYLYKFLNARETLDYYGRLFHQNANQRKKRIDMLLEMVGLEAVQHRPVGEYSKGMQRRIGLAQALINDPQLLILDEPTTGMDPLGTRQIKDLILTLAERGKTILLCSHLLADVEDVCDRVAIMYGGKLREYGSCDDLLVNQDVTSLTTDQLSDEVIAEVRGVLEKHGLSISDVSHPRQGLEDFFLDVVERAKEDKVETHGARSGGRIADFLADSLPQEAEVEEEESTEDVVSDLLASNEPEVIETPKKPVDAEPTQEEQQAELMGDLLESKPIKEEKKDESKKPQADMDLIEGLMDDD